MKSKELPLAKLEDEPLDMQDGEDDGVDVIVDEYKDMPIETLSSSRERFLKWKGL